MSPSGRYVAYPSSSSATVYVYDTESNSIARMFPFSSGTASWINCSDTKVAFATTTQLIIADIASGSSQTISNRLSDRAGLRFSGDGRYFVYATTNNVYAFDWLTGTNELISQALDGSAANGTSDSPDISADGRFITFVSSASNLVSGDANGVPDVFLYDTVAGTMSIVGSSRFGAGSANGRSMTPYFSPDGQTLVFESWGSDVVGQDFNDAGDLIALDIASVAPVYPGDPVMSFVTAPFTFFGMSAD
jgi:Tol biopolymer transport system component